MSTLIVTDEIIIHTTPSKVWEVLVQPRHIKSWDGLPDHYPDQPLKAGNELVWALPNGRYSKSTVVRAEKEKRLQLSLYVSDWEVDPAPEDILFSYELLIHEKNTRLRLRHGDFSILPNGQSYFEASTEFASVSKHRIKRLAELL
ncbi:SRPBCC family protein [Virgibacillus sediminis]|uniref:SRPBCC domain-containing protein n=1 Tax=Virgibacillus sediminis TaxID=202260 RepID=A0ABV7A3H4_9BACI